MEGLSYSVTQTSDAKAHRENGEGLPVPRHPEVPARSAGLEGCCSGARAVSFEARCARTSATVFLVKRFAIVFGP